MPKRNGEGIALLADPTRRRIVAAIAIRRRRPAELASEIGRSRPAITRQLNILSKAGLIEGRRSMIDGRGVLYGIDPERHGQITAWLLGTELVRSATAPAEESDWSPARANRQHPGDGSA